MFCQGLVLSEIEMLSTSTFQCKHLPLSYNGGKVQNRPVQSFRTITLDTVSEL